jgi:hypothetical protein
MSLAMTTAVLRSPSLASVVSEQLRASGLRLRREAVAAALIVGGLFVLTLIDLLLRGGIRSLGLAGGSVDFNPEMLEAKLMFPALGLLLPLALWRGEALFENAPLLSLPVERRRHLLIKVFAGWCWLLATMAALLAALAALALLTGGSIQIDEMRTVVTTSAGGEPVLAEMRWTTRPWQWLVPPLAASVAYLLASAFRIGVRYPWRWSVGVLLGGALLAAVGPNDSFVDHALDQLTGEIGLQLLLNGILSNNLPNVWPEPSFLVWAKAFAAWAAGATGLVWLAASRHKD